MDEDYKYRLMIPIESSKFGAIFVLLALLVIFDGIPLSIIPLNLIINRHLVGFMAPIFVFWSLINAFILYAIFASIYLFRFKREYRLLIDRNGVSVSPGIYKYLIPYNNIKGYEIVKTNFRGGTFYSFYLHLDFRARSISHPFGTSRLFLFQGGYCDEAANLLDYYLAMKSRGSELAAVQARKFAIEPDPSRDARNRTLNLCLNGALTLAFAAVFILELRSGVAGGGHGSPLLRSTDPTGYWFDVGLHGIAFLFGAGAIYYIVRYKKN